MWNQRMIWGYLIAVAGFSGCGRLSEQELRPATLNTSTAALGGSSSTCALRHDADSAKRDLQQVLRGDLEDSRIQILRQEWEADLQCVQTLYGEALRRIRGSHTGEVSIAEALRLIDERALNVERPSPQILAGLELLLRMMHPEGRPALRPEELSKLSSLAQRILSLLELGQNPTQTPVRRLADLLAVQQSALSLLQSREPLSPGVFSQLLATALQSDTYAEGLTFGLRWIWPTNADSTLDVSLLRQFLEQLAPSEAELGSLVRTVTFWGGWRHEPERIWKAQSAIDFEQVLDWVERIQLRVLPRWNWRAVRAQEVQAILTRVDASTADLFPDAVRILRRLDGYRGDPKDFSLSLSSVVTLLVDISEQRPRLSELPRWMSQLTPPITSRHRIAMDTPTFLETPLARFLDTQTLQITRGSPHHTDHDRSTRQWRISDALEGTILRHFLSRLVPRGEFSIDDAQLYLTWINLLSRLLIST